MNVDRGPEQVLNACVLRTVKSKVLSGENVCITNGEEQKARAKGLNRKVDTLKDEFASRCRSEDSALRATLVWEGHPIVEAISWEMRACDSMLARSDTGGRATRSVYQYTHGRGLGQEQAKTSFEGSQETS